MSGDGRRPSRPGPAAALAWLWVALVLAAYLHQFLPLLPNIRGAFWPY